MIRVQSRVCSSILQRQNRLLHQVAPSYIKNVRNESGVAVQKRIMSTTKRNFSSNPADTTGGRGPVSWTMFGIVGVAAAAAVSYYSVERERRMEAALGKIVTSESEGWTPDSTNWKPLKYEWNGRGWYPEETSFGPSESGNVHYGCRLFVEFGKPAIGAPWSLIDLNGRLVTEQDFAGKWTLLYFGFAHCPDICPSEMVKIAKVLDTIKKDNPQLADQIQPIFVSVDPARDTIHALKEYAKDFHPNYVFLTGTPQQVQQMAKKYRVYVSKADETDDGDYLIDHSIVVYLHDTKGELADLFTQSMKPSDIIDKVTHHMTNLKKN